MNWYEYIVLITYITALVLLFLYSLGQLQLTLHYLKNRRQQKDKLANPKEWPLVTIQLPIYNEQYVVERLIKSICASTYPKDKLEIQVLDDSDDFTSSIIRKHVDSYRNQGIDIVHIQRKNRVGFKAGALAEGLAQAKGQYLAIFDADFLPPKDFLEETIPYFHDEQIGMVQTRWGHINRDYSFFTKMQAFGLDAHFSVEQSSRNMQKSFINFNGTGGVWRKTCIEEAGGWSADTLTEDLDLSYRAQLKGWKFKFLEHIETPAELPILMPAIKSQQYRWNKGAAETSVKNLGNVYRSNQPFKTKLHATFHLLNSSVFLLLLIASITSLPLLAIKANNPQLDTLFIIGNVMLVGFFSIGFFYWVAAKKSAFLQVKGNFIATFFSFITISMGLSLHNSLAVCEGFLGRKTPFVRTPKFNASNESGIIKDNIYLTHKTDVLSILESILGLYFLGGMVLGIVLKDYGLILFHLMLTIGFFVVSYQSLKLKWYA